MTSTTSILALAALLLATAGSCGQGDDHTSHDRVVAAAQVAFCHDDSVVVTAGPDDGRLALTNKADSSIYFDMYEIDDQMLMALSYISAPPFDPARVVAPGASTSVTSVSPSGSRYLSLAWYFFERDGTCPIATNRMHYVALR